MKMEKKEIVITVKKDGVNYRSEGLNIHEIIGLLTTYRDAMIVDSLNVILNKNEKENYAKPRRK